MDKPTDTPHSRLRLRSPAGLMLLGAALLVLLGLVAAVSRAHHVPGGHAGGHRAPTGVGDYLVSILIVLMFVGTGALLYYWFTEREVLGQMRKARKKTRTYKALIVILVFASLLTLGARFHVLPSIHHRHGAGSLASSARARLRFKPIPPGVERAPKFEWLPVFVAGAAGLVALGYVALRTIRRSRQELLERHLLELRLESLLDETLDDLYAQKDPRAAIIAAYARMERLFGSAGLARHPSEAPLEYLGRALGEVHASGAALGRLTGLFQRAKFSEHNVDESMRSEAIEALTQVRDELRATREEDRLRREQAEAFRSRQHDLMKDAAPGEDPFVAAAEKARGISGARRW